MKFYTTIKQLNVHSNAKFCWSFSKTDKIVLLQPRQPSCLSVLSVVFSASLLVAVKRDSLLVLGDEMRMQTWRWTELLQIIGVTIVGSYSHVGSQAVGCWSSPCCSCGSSSQGLGPPFRRSATPKDRDETWIAGWYSLTLTLTLGIRPIDLRPPMASLRNGGPKPFTDGATFNSSVVLASAAVYVSVWSRHDRRDSSNFNVLKSGELGPFIVRNEHGTIRLQSVRDAKHAEKWVLSW